MNYNRIYNLIIDNAKGRRESYLLELHHIIPKCCGGKSVKENLVFLTPKEHYVCHQLLMKLFPEEASLLFVTHMMTRKSSKYNRDNKEYSWIKNRRSLVASETAKGKKRGKYSKDRKINHYELSIKIDQILKLYNISNDK